MEDRTRRAVLSITEDYTLTEDMDDSEAMILLDWGSTMAKRLTLYTAEMTDSQASAYLDEQIPRLRKVMRRVNSLIGYLPELGPEEAGEKLAKIFSAGEAVPVLDINLPDDFPTLGGQLKFLSRKDALNAVLNRLARQDPLPPRGDRAEIR